MTASEPSGAPAPKRSATANRIVSFHGVGNFRDLGGYESELGGSTRWGVLYRSDAIHRFSAADLEVFRALGARTVYDLRGDEERARDPDPVPSIHVPLEGYIAREAAPDLSACLTRMDGEERLRGGYLDVLATAGTLFGQLFSGFAERDNLPVVFHCAGGKDRTGLVAALLLSWLGVPRAVVLDDYALSSSLRDREREVFIHDLLVSLGMSEAATDGLLGAPRWVMEAALSAVDDLYGGVESYLRGVAKLDGATLTRLRELLLE